MCFLFLKPKEEAGILNFCRISVILPPENSRVDKVWPPLMAPIMAPQWLPLMAPIMAPKMAPLFRAKVLFRTIKNEPMTFERVL